MEGSLSLSGGVDVSSGGVWWYWVVSGGAIRWCQVVSSGDIEVSSGGVRWCHQVLLRCHCEALH